MNIWRQIGCAILIILVAAPAFAGNEGRIGTAGAQELRIPIGSRGTAMAGSAIATTNGIEAIYWNPAGVCEIEGTEAAFSHLKYIAGMQVNFAGVATDLGDFGTLGLSARVLSMDDIEITTVDNADGTGEFFSPAFSVLTLTFARRMTDRMAFGANLMYLNESILRERATGVAFDFGFVYNPDWRGLRFGAVVKNWGPDMSYDGPDFGIGVQPDDQDPSAPHKNVRTQSAPFELPSSVQLGVSYEVVNRNNNVFHLNSVYQNNNFNNDEMRLGGEYIYNDVVSLRGGYTISGQDEYIEGLALGFGLAFFVGETRMMVDYSWAQTEYFDDRQFYTVSVQF